VHSPLHPLNLHRRPSIWINDAWAANEILVKRANIYNSRPRMLMFAELGTGQANLINMYTYTSKQRERFRDLRKITHHGVGIQQVSCNETLHGKFLTISKVQGYRKFQDDENKVVVYDLLITPDDFVAHFERYAASVVSIVGFGRRISSTTDPIITEVISLMQAAAHVAVIAKDFPRLMETFPWMAKFPNFKAAFSKSTSALKSHDPQARHRFFYALALEANEREHENYCKYLFRVAPEYKLTPAELSSLAANLIGAGADTSSSTLVTAVLAMRAFPSTLIPARTELDRVVGHTRSPGPKDDLPYMRALVKEVFRWRSVAIIGGTAHAPTQDDTWNGYHIPKATWMQGNVWAMHHNEREFPDPDRFEPRRFLESDSEWKREFPGEKGYMTFGWGRRSCAGQALAEQGTFLSVCRLVWAFSVLSYVDRNGVVEEVDIFKYT
jgi:hypothetical protein